MTPLVVAATWILLGPAPAAAQLQHREPSQESAGDPVQIEVEGGPGLIDVVAEPAVCIEVPVQCDGFQAVPAAATNDNPVRLVVQLRSALPPADLTLEAFDLQTQVSPERSAPVVPAGCPDCFQDLGEGTYAIWVVPAEGDWTEGSYFVRVALPASPAMLAALARIEIPARSGPPEGEPPVAVIRATPAGEQQVTLLATFDGSDSSDPDGEITMYQWTISSSDPDPGRPATEVVESPAALTIQRVYEQEQQLTVQLKVTDAPDAERLLAAGKPIPYDDAAVLSYAIVCRNDPPVAIIAGPDVIRAVGSPATLTSIVLDGRLSFDTETAIDRYFWSCGNEFAPVPIAFDGSIVVCRYRLGSYIATLQVLDRGTGVIDPNTGTYECQKVSARDTVTIEIVPPGP